MSRLRDHCPRVGPAYSLMPREGSRSGDLQIYGSHTPYTLHTKRLNISNVSQSAKSLQGTFSSNLSGGLSILQSPLQRKIPRFVFPGPGLPKRLNHFQGSSKANNKEPKPRFPASTVLLSNPACASTACALAPLRGDCKVGV